MKAIRRHRTIDSIEYTIIGTQNEDEIKLLDKKIHSIVSDYIIHYNQFRYTPPEMKKWILDLFWEYESKPAQLWFQSSSFNLTLEEYIETKGFDKLTDKQKENIISQMWKACNSVREHENHIQTLSLHPKNIAVKYLPFTNEQECNFILLSYIPLIFKDIFTEEEKLYIYPQALKQMLSLDYSQPYPSQTEIYSLGCLISYLYTGRLPFKPGTNSENLMDENEDYLQLPELSECKTTPEKAEMILELLNEIFLNNLTWEKSSQNKYIDMILKQIYNAEKPKKEDFSEIQLLGNGNFATCFEAIQTTSRGKRKVCIKEIPYNQNLLQNYENEFRILSICDHPNIVKLYSMIGPAPSFCDKRYEKKKVIDFVMELADGKTLESFHHENFPNSPLPKEYMQHFLVELLNGLQYLHELNIFHRDLKPANILLQLNPFDSTKPHVKISDFGISKIVEGDSTSTFCGTPLFAAPQIFFGSEYTLKCDLYSVGVILYNWKSLSFPYGKAKNIQEITRNFSNPDYPNFKSSFWNDDPRLLELIQGLVKYEENERYDWNDIMNNEYVKEAFEEYHK